MLLKLTQALIAGLVLLLISNPALSQEETKKYNSIPMSTITMCMEPEEAKRLVKDYGEVQFMEGKGVIQLFPSGKFLGGTMKFFADPDDWSYTIFFADPEDKMWCGILMGEELAPAVAGDKL